MMRHTLPLLSLLWCAAAVAGPGEQPRLFFAPQERPGITAARLQQARRDAGLVAGDTGSADAAGAGSAGREAAPDVPRRPARIEGISLAHEGRAAAWIGGRRYDDGAMLAGHRLHITRDGVRFVDGPAAGALLKVGQTVGGLWLTADNRP